MVTTTTRPASRVNRMSGTGVPELMALLLPSLVAIGMQGRRSLERRRVVRCRPRLASWVGTGGVSSPSVPTGECRQVFVNVPLLAEGARSGLHCRREVLAVSYTHLTLP